jgi:hypothetical protein
MATGNMLLGLARKKLGDVVFYRSEGQQRSRVRVRDIKNPRTAKQSVQRMVLATAAKMAAAFEPIVNHSWEGTPTGVASTRKFRSLAMRVLRNAAAQAVDSDEVTIQADFAIKGAPVVGAVAGLPISRGSLSMKPWEVGGDGQVLIPYTPSASALVTMDDLAAELAKLGLQPGDQITIIQLFQNIDVPVAQFGNEQNFAQAVRYSRVTFATSLPAGFEGGQLITNGAFNPAFIANSQGSMYVTTSEGNLVLSIYNEVPSPDLGNVILSTIVRSQRQATGNFKYSSAEMKVCIDNLDYNNAVEVYPSYMENVEGIDVGDIFYLRNAVAQEG